MSNSPKPSTEKTSKWRKLEAYGLLFVAIFWLLIYLAFVIFMAIGAKRVGHPVTPPTSNHHAAHENTA
jgi:uncharacterized membrane protein